MGGSGSGRLAFGSSRTVVEEHKSIDVNRMRRDGSLIPGRCGQLFWSRSGAPSGSINWRAEAGRLVLTFRYRVNGGDWTDIEQPLPVVWTSCRFGGERPWFICPGVVSGHYCGRRVLKVYAGGRYFLCRHCYRLVYRCQSESRMDRLMRQADKRRVALGGESGMFSPLPEKPKGMHWRTFWWRMAQIETAEDDLRQSLLIRFAGEADGSPWVV